MPGWLSVLVLVLAGAYALSPATHAVLVWRDRRRAARASRPEGPPRNVRFDPRTNRPATPVGTAEASWGSPRYAADCC